MPHSTSLPRRRIENLPVLVLILLNIVLGLFTFRDYGFSLDEPLFYGYADALGYAYSPSEWFRPDFDLGRAYGPSAWDHMNRGPAYLLLARGPAHLLRSMGVDQASAWHLVNFLAFQVGIFFFYVLALRWMKPWAAFFASALFSTQPVLWEHAFINPKDPPFMVFFLISLELGFRMADYLAEFPDGEKPGRILAHVALPAILLGLTTSIRILGPLAALLVGIYFLLLKKPSRIWWFVPYGLIAIAAMLASWPFLWEDPVRNFIGTLTFMSDNPTELRVLFYGKIYRASNLPLRYLPALLLFTLTEPVWPLALGGIVAGVVRAIKKNINWKSLLPTVLWFSIPMAYVLAFRPPMYDGFRHFMFIVPPLFILAGLSIDVLFAWLRNAVLRSAVIMVLLVPGVLAYAALHPYEYAYFNQFVGGTSQVAGRFETDYWFTCYKDAMEQVNKLAQYQPVVYVPRDGYGAQYYAAHGVTVINGDYMRQQRPLFGQYVLEGSRANPGIQKYLHNTNMIVIQRQRAVFCTVILYTK
jgi:hypothetical protein